MRASWILVSAVLLATASVAPAITISFNGNFNQDDDVVLFQYSVQNAGFVTIGTTSFAGGGFSPILTVFDEFGVFLYENVGYTNAIISDATIPSFSSNAGANYFVTLSQYDNQSNAGRAGFGNLSDGFFQAGQGNFTGDLVGSPGGSFMIFGPEQRTNHWAVEFTSAEPTLQASIPEPSTAALGAIGAAMFYGLARARKRKNQV